MTQYGLAYKNFELTYPQTPIFGEVDNFLMHKIHILLSYKHAPKFSYLF